MGLPLALAIASTGISVVGSMQSAKAAKAQGRLQARQFANQQKDISFTALQEHNKRLSNLKTFINSNEAILGTSGRAMDRSYEAIIKKARMDARTDTTRLRIDAAMKTGQASLQGSMAMLQAQNRANAYKLQALGSIMSGATKAYPLMPNSAMPIRGTGLGQVGFST